MISAHLLLLLGFESVPADEEEEESGAEEEEEENAEDDPNNAPYTQQAQKSLR